MYMQQDASKTAMVTWISKCECVPCLSLSRDLSQILPDSYKSTLLALCKSTCT
jgi:hypothetical protein